MKKFKPRERTVIAGIGIPCPRCESPTQIRTHAAVTQKMLRQPFYYRRWYYCTNMDCVTTMVMRDEDKVPTHEGHDTLWTETRELPFSPSS